MLRECRWARPEVVCCSKVMGSRPRWAKSFCSTYCKRHEGPVAAQPQDSAPPCMLLFFFKVIQFYLEKSCLQLPALTFGIESAHCLLSYFKKGKFY